MAEKYIEGIGRRKTSTSRVRIFEGKKPSTVNGVPVADFFKQKGAVKTVTLPMSLTGFESKYYFTAIVEGGGITGQLEAVQLGLARAIVKSDIEAKPVLRKNGLVTRDPRMVERKKYNLKKARRQNQFSKR